MRIFLTGGTGFIGSYLLRELLLSGHEVLSVRRPGSYPVIGLNRQPLWLERTLLDLNTHDLEGVEVVIHLASAGVSPQKASWNVLEKINVAAGIHLIQLAHQVGVKRFLAAGTCLEYGLEAHSWERIPADAALRPQTPYGASKAAGFSLLNSFALSNAIEFFYGRIFNAYGFGQFCGNLWPSLQSKAALGEDLTLNNGHNVRDFIPVETVARHLLMAINRSDVKDYNPMVVNIGTGQGTSVFDFANEHWKLFSATGSLKLCSLSTRKMEANRIVADITNLEVK